MTFFAGNEPRSFRVLGRLKTQKFFRADGSRDLAGGLMIAIRVTAGNNFTLDPLGGINF